MIDLHTHSTASDGTDPPAQLVAKAAAAGVRVLALTDHDTTAGWPEAARAAVRHGVTLLPGEEISCSSGGIGVHLLALLHDPAHPQLRELVEATREDRFGRLRRMAGLLARDYPISWDDVLAQVPPGATVGRPHLADALVARGIVPSRDAAFARLLHAGSRYYLPHTAPDTLAVVRLVREAGGVPLLAHGRAGRRGRVIDAPVIAELAEAGLAGLEVDHPDHDEAGRRELLALAAELGLLVTGASDYHGSGKPNVLAEHVTSPQVLEAVVASGSGTPVVRP